MNESSVDAAHPGGSIRLGVFKTNRSKVFDLTVASWDCTRSFLERLARGRRPR